MGNIWELGVYQRAIALSDDVHERTATWDSFDRWTVGVQLVRAADSIGANLAEGFGRGSDADRMRFLLIARGSAAETEHWLERAVARGLLDDRVLPDEAREIVRMLHGLIKSLRP